ncbi:MAG TPA: peptidyl-prolyl cis-trans isomerase [Syntrophobacteraceae bacterium]|nr:peptidyl-prolyl cis-trans isomerase [Syntrophobacteraceae bacterium]
MIPNTGVSAFRTIMAAWALWACALLCSAARGEEPPEKALAVIGSARITARDLENRIERLSPVLREEYSSEEGRQRLLREMVRIEVFSMEARARGLDRAPEFQRKLAEVEKALLADHFAKEAVLPGSEGTEEEAWEYYARHLEEFQSPEKIRVSSVFLECPRSAPPDERARRRLLAEEILQRARNGEDFPALARKHSSKSPDEEAGYFSRGRYLPEIEERIFALNPGELGPILETEGGLWLFRVEDRLPPAEQPYGAVRAEILARLRMEKGLRVFDDLENRLFAKYAVKFPGEDSPASQEGTASRKEGGSPAMEGTITTVTRAAPEIREAGGRGSIFVEAGPGAAPGMDRASIGITSKTQISRKTGGRLREATAHDLKKGQRVRIFISGPVGSSYPVQADADSVVILEDPP